MSKISAVLAVVILAALSAPAFAAEGTLTGELVDRACYMKAKTNVGAEHKDCAVTCAKKGQTVALVTANGDVYDVAGDLAADNNAKLVPHMSHKVELTGDAMTMDGKKMIHATALKMAPKPS